MTDQLRVTIRFGEPLRRAVGHFRIDVTLSTPSTLADLRAYLQKTYPDFVESYQGLDLSQPYPYRWFVNHRPVAEKEVETFVLHHDDLIHLVVPIAGGGPSRRQLPDATTQRAEKAPAGGSCDEEDWP